jgi:acyl carrier protein
MATVDRDAVTRHLTALWTGILGKEVGPNDDFFDVGGSSLAGIKMIIDVQSVYGVELDVESFFEEPTIARLADAIGQGQVAAATSAKQTDSHQVP